MTIPLATFTLGVLLFLVSLPTLIIAFAFALFWLYLVGLVIGATGVFLIALGIFLRLAYFLFRA